MAANYVAGGAAVGEYPKALLLREEVPFPEDEKLAALLDCVGVQWQGVSRREIADASTSIARYCVLTSARYLWSFLQSDVLSGAELPDWMSKAQSVYIYGFAEDHASQRLLRFLTGSAKASVRTVKSRQVAVSVSGEFPEICGPMSGLQFRAQTPEKQTVFDLAASSDTVHSIVGSDQGQFLVSANSRGARLFLNASEQVVDVAAPCAKYLDVRETFADTVPVLMYLRFALRAFPSTEIGACLIVDDPLLKPRYGFLNYSKLLRLMDQHNFSTTMAFIPWNYRRTDAKTVQLFHPRPDRFSLCVHGCDHTAREFAERSPAILNRRVKVASYRMHVFQRRTRLPYYRVMLFPQGAFSASAAESLKLNGFVAITNTEVSPVHRDENKTTVGDLLSLAIMKYASFPIFTRRYLAHGVENFAFDGLLGKPCLIAAHHDDFANESRALLHVIGKLNSLHWKLRWRSLGDILKQACRYRENQDGHGQLEMYGPRLVYANRRESAERVQFVKRESDAGFVNVVTVHGQPVDFLHREGYLRFEATIPPKESVELRVLYSHNRDMAALPGDLRYRASALARRYLSEFRDNYLSRNTNLLQRAVKVKQALGL